MNNRLDIKRNDKNEAKDNEILAERSEASRKNTGKDNKKNQKGQWRTEKKEKENTQLEGRRRNTG